MSIQRYIRSKRVYIHEQKRVERRDLGRRELEEARVGTKEGM